MYIYMCVCVCMCVCGGGVCVCVCGVCMCKGLPFAVRLLSANYSNIFWGFDFHFTLTVACLSLYSPFS